MFDLPDRASFLILAYQIFSVKSIYFYELINETKNRIWGCRLRFMLRLAFGTQVLHRHEYVKAGRRSSRLELSLFVKL